jgi:hypothetical protein
MFIGKFVKKLFKKEDSSKGDKKLKLKVKAGMLEEQIKKEVIKNSKYMHILISNFIRRI